MKYDLKIPNRLHCTCNGFGFADFARDSFKKRVSAEESRGTDADRTGGDDECDEQSVAVMDAFLVFRAFCKLSSKDISAER
jgi:hypothetical protein